MAYNNYKIVEGEDKSLYYIKENKTEHIIRSFKEFNEARRFMVSLNKGAAFDGWTPKFFLQNCKKTENSD